MPSTLAARVRDNSDCDHLATKWGACNACGHKTISDAVFDATLALDTAGWPSVADDLHDGIEPAVILSRLRRMAAEGEDTASAESIVAPLAA